MYEWNPVYNLVMSIKNEYKNKFGIDTIDFNTWIEKLNNVEYNDIFDCLQTNQYNNYLLIRYGIADMQESMWTDSNSIYRECRSIVIDLENEELVLTPFRKFFNMDEIPENNVDVISDELNKAKIVEYTNKLDGSMQSARYYKDNYFMSGSMALSADDSWRLQDGYSMLTDNYKTMLYENQDYTFIFEYISMKDAHVVLYNANQQGLYLIGIRNVYTGEELNYYDIKLFAEKYDIPMTQIEETTLDEILDNMKKLKSNEKEGWVINIDGHKIKIKCDDYINLHRLLDKMSSINVVIQNIAEDRYDDMISKILDNYKIRIEKISNEIFKYKHNTENWIRYYYDNAPKDDRKTFMIWVDKNCPPNLIGYIKSVYLNKEFNVLKNNSNSYKKLNELGIIMDYSAAFAYLEEKDG